MIKLMRIYNMARALVADRDGVTSIEYGLIGALIFVVIVGSVSLVGVNLKPIFTAVSNGF